MKMQQSIWLTLAFCAFALLIARRVDAVEKPVVPGNESSQEQTAGTLSVEVARDRVKVMQDIHSATLTMMHDRYFHRDKSIVPARAMQDVFSQIERQSGVETRWISASLHPMSIDHAPESEFEKRAAKEIAAGKPSLEVVEDDYYRRAIAIPLTGGCLGCHETQFQRRVGKQFAGLVISMPLRTEKQ